MIRCGMKLDFSLELKGPENHDEEFKTNTVSWGEASSPLHKMKPGSVFLYRSLY